MVSALTDIYVLSFGSVPDGLTTTEQLSSNKLDNLKEMDTSLQTQNFPRLNYEEMECSTSLITREM